VADDGTVGNATIRLMEIARSENSTTVVETATQNLRQFGTLMRVTRQSATWTES
jgi:murein L,D-transpeptidase YcbB/YkuD